MLFKLLDRRLIDTIGQYVGQHSANMLRSTVSGVSVNWGWYQYIAYATKCREISQGLELRNSSQSYQQIISFFAHPK